MEYAPRVSMRAPSDSRRGSTRTSKAADPATRSSPEAIPAHLAACIELARVAERQGHHAEAIRAFEAALANIREPDDAAYAPALLRWVGSCYRARGDRAAALDCFRASLCVARLQRSATDVAHALNWFGIIRQDQGRLKDADRLFRSARRHARRGGDERLLAMIEQNLGIDCNIRGDLRAALRHYRGSLACYEQLGEPRFIAQALNLIGLLHTDAGDWAAAGRAFQRSAKLCADVGDIHTQTMVEVNRVELFRSRGQFAEAREACDRAHALAVQSGSRPALGEVFRLFGAIHLHADDRRLAEHYLHLALDTARECELPLQEAESLRELAGLYRAQDKNREALAALLDARGLFKRIQAQRDLTALGRRLADLESQFHAIVLAWAESIESKDHYTHGHCNRVATYATTLARHFGFDEDSMHWFRMGAYLHDVGKTVVPIEILNKSDRLTPEEFDVLKRHTTAGDAIVSDLNFPWDIRPMVRSHHERWDGSGYPDGLCGEAIPLAARILGVVDVFDALTTTRPYRSAHSVAVAIAIMDQTAERHFDPDVYAVFRALVADGVFADLDAA